MSLPLVESQESHLTSMIHQKAHHSSISHLLLLKITQLNDTSFSLKQMVLGRWKMARGR